MNMESNEKPIINRIKVVLVEQRRTNKWLADTLGKDCTTVSKWCTNTAQPGLETLVKIAECLDVDARELIVPTKKRIIGTGTTDSRQITNQRTCPHDSRTYDSLKWR